MGVVYDQVAAVVRWIYDRRIAGPPVLDSGVYFPHAKDLQCRWRDIRDEALIIARNLSGVPRFHEIMPEQAEISANDQRDWRLFIIKAYGVTIPANMAACPTLASLVSAPDVLSASFSFLAPQKHIPAHRGPFRGILRFYLVLSMPTSLEGKPAAVLRIADKEYALADGDSLLWDDTYEHEIWNDSNEVRTVLLLDVARRGMPVDMIVLSKILILIAQFGMWLRDFGGAQKQNTFARADAR